MDNERIGFLLTENKKLSNRVSELEKEILIKDEIIRKQVCMMNGKRHLGISFAPVQGVTNAQLPERKTKFAAGYDFYAPHDIYIPAHGRSALVHFNVKALMPKDYFLQLKIRSGLSVNHGIMLACSGIIDADFAGNADNDGNIGAKFINFSDKDYLIKKGERCMQGIFQRYCVADDDNADGIRGGGYGSTGR